VVVSRRQTLSSLFELVQSFFYFFLPSDYFPNMDVLMEEKSNEKEAVTATQADSKLSGHSSGEARRISGSPNNFCVSELEDNGDNDSVAAPVSEVPQDDHGEESDYEYEYEDDDDAHFGSFIVGDHHSVTAAAPVAGSSPDSPARIVEEEAATSAGTSSNEEEKVAKKPKWKEPSKDAVNMSLRAERETSGGKRRLALDLYKIMMADTEEAGFSLEPKSEDSMDVWTIKLFAFDKDSPLHKDMLVMGLDHIELEMTFPEQYPFAPPFVRVVRPRFVRQTGFVMDGALCMELLTSEGWNPVNDIESVIVSIRSLVVVGEGRLAAAAGLADEKYEALLKAALKKEKEGGKRERSDSTEKLSGKAEPPSKLYKEEVGEYSKSEAESAYEYLSGFHKEKGWSGWWARRG
jgi:ubiquitin-conjugating enzyme E2 Q